MSGDNETEYGPLGPGRAPVKDPISSFVFF